MPVFLPSWYQRVQYSVMMLLMAHVRISTTTEKKRKKLLGNLVAAFIQSEQKLKKYRCTLCFGSFTVKPFIC